ncbi:C40 family peptidase [Embleya scabrispora]|uniref:C40 family peptidase n=1 Tax=Embleya scabrispora TaxID=159449 RepID=UPI0011807136|nr:C40 family peptidase [Embleya scabrispora]
MVGRAVGGAVIAGFAAAPGGLVALAGRLRAVAREVWALRERVAAVDVAASRPLAPETFEVLRSRLREAVETLDRAERGGVDLADRLVDNARSYAEADQAAASRLLDLAPAGGRPAGLGPADGWIRAGEPSFAPPEVYDGPFAVRPIGRGAGVVRVAAPGPDGEEIVARAKRWADLGLGYSMSGFHDGYRTDCSGLVSMAWGLPPPGLTTVTLPEVSHPIGKDDLRPGDILLNTAPGAAGHTLVFAGWADAAHTRYHAYEESSGKGAHHGTIPYPYWPGHGTFRPYRLGA